MSLIHEILRAVFVAFGASEFFINMGYLIKSDGISSARKQHQEVPPTTSDHQMRIKVTCMMIVGLIFLISGCIAYLTHSYPRTLFHITTVLLGCYAWVEALYYKYWKTFGFAAVATLILLLVFFL